MSIPMKALHPLVLRIGSSRAVVIGKNRTIIFDEPARIAISARTGSIVAFGQEAVDLGLLGAPEISVLPIIHDGIVQDRRLCQEYLGWMRAKFTTTKLRQFIPYTVHVVESLDCPADYSNIFSQCLQATHFFPLGKSYAVQGDAWMALGSKVKSQQLLLIRMGATQTQIAVLASDLVVASATLPIGGEDIDTAIVHHLRQTAAMSVPLSAIAGMKEAYTKAAFADSPFSFVVRGKNVATNEVQSTPIKSNDLSPLLDHFFAELAQQIHYTIATQFPSEILSQTTLPLYVSGGISSFSQSATFIEQEMQKKVLFVSRPTLASALGAAGKITA